jgi:hypothetical protein
MEDWRLADMAAFLKSIGAAGKMDVEGEHRSLRLDDDWLTSPWGALQSRLDLLDRVWFATNKRPSGVRRGDKLVFYAAGWERFFGIGIVASDEPYEQTEPGEERWPWILDVKVPLVVPRLSLAPMLTQIGVASTSVRQQSHIRLTDEQYTRALDSLLALAR